MQFFKILQKRVKCGNNISLTLFWEGHYLSISMITSQPLSDTLTNEYLPEYIFSFLAFSQNVNLHIRPFDM